MSRGGYGLIPMVGAGLLAAIAMLVVPETPRAADPRRCALPVAPRDDRVSAGHRALVRPLRKVASMRFPPVGGGS